MKQLFSHLIKDFTYNLDVASNSRALYLRILQQFSKWVVIEGRDIKNLKRSDILEYKATLLRENKSESTIDLYLTTLRSFFEWLEAIGEHENIAAGIRLKHKRKGYKKAHLEKEEIENLIKILNTDTLIGKRDYAMINLMLLTGVRCIEVSRMRVCDLFANDNEYSLLLKRKGANTYNEKIGLTLKAYQPIKNYLEYRGVSDDQEPVFITHCSTGSRLLTADRVGRIVTSYMKQAGIHSKEKTAHSLRHTTAVQAILRKVPIREIQLLLGHTNVQTTEIYLHSINDKIRLSNPAVHALDDLF